MCHANKRRYDCTCPVGFWGHRCQFKVRSCRDVLLGHETKPNGFYSVFDQDDILFQAYCDFNSEPNFAWTLIMSYSFQNRGAFMQKPFYLYDMEINQNAHQWDRLSLVTTPYAIYPEHVHSLASYLQLRDQNNGLSRLQSHVVCQYRFSCNP